LPATSRREPPPRRRLASIPEKIRGFGHVKQRHLAAAKAEEAMLLEQFRAGAPALLKAAE
jgi:indolepyruvate ferredoxin oxidoreductase